MKIVVFFLQRLQHTLFGDHCTDKTSVLYQALCLPVLVEELITRQTNDESNCNVIADEDENDRVRFFLIDCRSADQYNAGHPTTAFHLDCNLVIVQIDTYNFSK